ncbi:MAG: methyltransferase domain-containing protein [bacterium]|nr:MAG: methyltransferase domain-containing protein [bacterium]
MKKIKQYLMYITGKYKSYKYSARDILKLDLGSGDYKRKGFVGIDFSKGADISWDLLWGIPFGDDSVDEIKSDHFFEHLKIDELIYIFNECRRVLKKGGILDFTVPHIDPYINAYVKNDISFLKSKINDIPKKYKKVFDNPFDIMMWLLYRNGEHKVFFDKVSIVQKLKYVGFKKVTVRKVKTSEDINIRFSSIYVTAIK